MCSFHRSSLLYVTRQTKFSCTFIFFIRISLCVCICNCVCVLMCVCRCVCADVCVYRCVCMQMCVYRCVYTDMCMQMCACVCRCVCVCVFHPASFLLLKIHESVNLSSSIGTKHSFFSCLMATMLSKAAPCSPNP